MRKRTVLALLCSLLGGMAAPVGAAVLIEVNVNNPAAVTFTATGNASQVDDTSSTLYDGVDLIGFFTGTNASFLDNVFSGNLTTPNSASASLTRKELDAYPTENTTLALYRTGEFYDVTQEFSTAAPAFTGVGIADLSLGAAFLPAAGASGDIIAGYSGGGSHAVIGQWVAVVPEPSMAIVGGAGAAMFLLRRRNAV